MTLLRREAASGKSGVTVSVLTVPEATATAGRAGCVVIGWRRTEGFFAFVVPDESGLVEEGQEEEGAWRR